MFELFKNWKHKEMSKRLLIIILALIFILLPIIVVASLVLGDASILKEYVIGAFSLGSVAFGFYFWKAKNENIHKYAKEESETEKAYTQKLIDELINEDVEKKEEG